MTTSARPWPSARRSARPSARRSDAHGAIRRQVSRLRITALLLVAAAVAVALVPARGPETRPTVGILLVLAAAAFARILTDTSRVR